LSYIFNLFLISLKEEYSLKKSFYIKIFGMIFNNAAFLTIFYLLFNKVGEIKGWSINDFLLLHSIVLISFGIYGILFSGISELSYSIYNGKLDNQICQPKNILIKLSIKTNMSSLGDIITGVIVFFLSGYYSIGNLFLLIIFILNSTIIFYAFSLIAHSLAFFFGPIYEISRQIQFTLLAFCTYPGSIYKGFSKILIFTIIPAGFLAIMPTEIIMNNEYSNIFYLFLSSSLFLLLSIKIFYFGLRKYESGNVFTTN